MFEPVKAALGAYMSGFYARIRPTTKPLNEYIARGMPYSVVMAPTKLVDEVEKMLLAWQRNDTYTATTRPAKLPVIFVGVAQDYTPTSREYTRQISNPIDVALPGDSLNRVFKLSTIAGDIRAQIAFVAAEEPTAKSLAAQFALYIDAPQNRRFLVPWTFAGATNNWACTLETPETPASRVQTENYDCVILVMDLTLRTTVPLFEAPGVGDPNDGQGTPGTDNPAGYPVALEVNDYSHYEQ